MSIEKIQQYSEHAAEVVNYTVQAFGEQVAAVGFYMVSERLIPALIQATLTTGRTGPDPEYITFALSRRISESVGEGGSLESMVVTAHDLLNNPVTFIEILREADELTESSGFGSLMDKE